MDGSRLAPAPPPRPIPKKTLNFRPLIYLGILIIIILLSWNYRSQFTNLKSQISNQLLSNSPTPFPQWMTYSNPEFSFQYPGEWGLPQKTLTGCGSIESLTDPEKLYEISISTKCNHNNATGKPYLSLEDYLKESPSKISYVVYGKTKVAKITSYLGTAKSATEIIFMTKSQTIYSVSLGHFTISDNPPPIPASTLTVFDKILSTLKFIYK